MNFKGNYESMPLKKGMFLISEKRTRITITRRRKKSVVRAYCKHCGKEVDWMPFEEACEILDRKLLASDSSNFEVLETDKGETLVCEEAVLKLSLIHI